MSHKIVVFKSKSLLIMMVATFPLLLYVLLGSREYNCVVSLLYLVVVHLLHFYNKYYSMGLMNSCINLIF